MPACEHVVPLLSSCCVCWAYDHESMEGFQKLIVIASLSFTGNMNKLVCSSCLGKRGMW
jgi:hypothetical protein